LRTAAGEEKDEEEDREGCWFHGIVVSGFRMQDAG